MDIISENYTNNNPKLHHPKEWHYGRVCIASSVLISSTLVLLVAPKLILVDSTPTINMILLSVEEKIELLMAVLDGTCNDGL
jgi:hypothetical protein